jgi:hypothetical protein
MINTIINVIHTFYHSFSLHKMMLPLLNLFPFNIFKSFFHVFLLLLCNNTIIEYGIESHNSCNAILHSVLILFFLFHLCFLLTTTTNHFLLVLFQITFSLYDFAFSCHQFNSKTINILHYIRLNC